MFGIYQIQIKINFINIFHEIFIYFFQILKKNYANNKYKNKKYAKHNNKR